MRFVLLLIAAVIAVVAGIVALQWSGKSNKTTVQTTTVQSSEAPVNTVDILVAKEPIPIGAIIDEAMIEKQPWPQHLVLEGFIVAGSKGSDITGRIARSNFQAREPFIKSKLANPNDPSFLAAMLPAGSRAVTLATDAISGVAGYVFPGDRVDILLTHNVREEMRQRAERLNTAVKPASTEVLLDNVRVLAVNVREAAGKETKNTTPSSVTIEVDDSGAQKLRLAEKVGTLSLSLRSIQDAKGNEIPAPTDLSELTRVRVVGGVDNMGIKIVRGAGGSKNETISEVPGNAIEITPPMETPNMGMGNVANP